MNKISVAALFIPSASPGRVYQFLLRRAGFNLEHADRLADLDLQLSDGVGDSSIRVLIPSQNLYAKDAIPFFQNIAPLLAQAFPPEVTLLSVDANQWNYTVWRQEGEPLEEGGETIAGIPFWSLRRLSAPKDAPDAARMWAERRGLPIARVPGFSKNTPALVEYVAVAGLDQRRLLVETTPRLYTFQW